MKNMRSIPIGWIDDGDGSFSPPIKRVLGTEANRPKESSPRTGEPDEFKKPRFGFEIKPSNDEAKLNKTEKAYLAYLRGLGAQWIGIQNITLKLGDDCRYTPDFFAIDNEGVFHAREVKGFWRDDAKVKIKVAARMFPMFRFTVAVKSANGWAHTEVKP